MFCSFLSADQIAEEQGRFANSPEMEEFRGKLRNLIGEYIPPTGDAADLRGQMAMEVHRVALEFFPNFEVATPPRRSDR
jgi:hypothetical protein